MRPDTEHVVHFYGQEDGRLEQSAGTYLAEGLARGDGLLVVATAAHLAAFARRLRGHAGYQASVREGRLALLDARAVLPAITADGPPDWHRFERIVGGALRDLRARAGVQRIRAYGELVGLLWAQGQGAAAVRLEEYWNRLLERDPLELYCAYPIDVLGSDFRGLVVAPILCTHTHVVGGDEGLSDSLRRATDEVLGTEATAVRARIRHESRTSAAAIPGGEAVALWLHDHPTSRAREILERARDYRRV